MIEEQKYKEAIKKLKTGKKISYSEAIYFKCLDCFSFDVKGVKNCEDDECVLYYYKTLTKHKK